MRENRLEVVDNTISNWLFLSARGHGDKPVAFILVIAKVMHVC